MIRDWVDGGGLLLRDHRVGIDGCTISDGHLYMNHHGIWQKYPHHFGSSGEAIEAYQLYVSDTDIATLMRLALRVDAVVGIDDQEIRINNACFKINRAGKITEIL